MTAADVLGWEAFQQLLARFAATAYGRDRALALRPSPVLAEVHARLEETAEARRALAS